jgi:hypothetical protein
MDSENVLSLRNAGVELKISTLKVCVLIVIEKFDKNSLLKENGGKYSFSDSWCSKWYKSHKFVVRKATQGIASSSLLLLLLLLLLFLILTNK